MSSVSKSSTKSICLLKAALFFLISLQLVTSEGGIEDNRAIDRFYGVYTLQHAWPVPYLGFSPVAFPDCAVVQYRKYEYEKKEPYKCDCRRTFTNLALVEQRSNFAGWPLLVDIVDDALDVPQALDDDCYCSPNVEMGFAVIRRVIDDCIVLHERTRGTNNSYLMCQNLRRRPKMAEVMKYLTEPLTGAGKIMCSGKKPHRRANII